MGRQIIFGSLFPVCQMVWIFKPMVKKTFLQVSSRQSDILTLFMPSNSFYIQKDTYGIKGVEDNTNISNITIIITLAYIAKSVKQIIPGTMLVMVKLIPVFDFQCTGLIHMSRFALFRPDHSEEPSLMPHVNTELIATETQCKSQTKIESHYLTLLLYVRLI